GDGKIQIYKVSDARPLDEFEIRFGESTPELLRRFAQKHPEDYWLFVTDVLKSRFGFSENQVAKVLAADVPTFDPKKIYDEEALVKAIEPSIEMADLPGAYWTVGQRLSNGWTLLGYKGIEEDLASGEPTLLVLFWKSPPGGPVPGKPDDGWEELDDGQWLQRITVANLLTNGDFEKGEENGVPVGYPGNIYKTNPAVKKTVTTERNGRNTTVGVLENNETDMSTGFVSTGFKVLPDTDYLLAGWIRSEGNAYLGWRWSGELQKGNRGYDYIAAKERSGEWRHYSGLVEPISGAQDVRIWLLNFKSTGTVYFDDVIFVPITTPRID
ncbi:MAG: hypothetical protein GXP38_03755, partial [Chloroflexi bacterium]|nr:hypothetical protein [Chloroflexota bacterium]